MENNMETETFKNRKPLHSYNKMESRSDMQPDNYTSQIKDYAVPYNAPDNTSYLPSKNTLKKIAITGLTGLALVTSGCVTTSTNLNQDDTQLGGGGGGGGGGCFTPKTPVLMASGETKPIEEVKVGDSVKSFDFNRNETVENSVVALFKFQKSSHLIINGIEVTREHPFCIGKGLWKEAGLLKVGDTLIDENSEEIMIESIEEIQKDVTVHNLTVDGTHNYFVSNGDKNFLVHNKGGGGGS